MCTHKGVVFLSLGSAVYQGFPLEMEISDLDSEFRAPKYNAHLMDAQDFFPRNQAFSLELEDRAAILNALETQTAPVYVWTGTSSKPTGLHLLILSTNIFIPGTTLNA